jgi:hypothetical protein
VPWQFLLSCCQLFPSEQTRCRFLVSNLVADGTQIYNLGRRSTCHQLFFQSLLFARYTKSTLHTPIEALHLSLVALLCPFEFRCVTRTNRARVQTLCNQDMPSNMIGQYFTTDRISQSPFLHICLTYHSIPVWLSTSDDRHRPDTSFHGLQATGVMLVPV